MPVCVQQKIQAMTEQSFYDLDFKIMNWAFKILNQMGRFFDEKIYKNKLAEICRSNGVSADTEVAIELTHQNFSKTLYIDLLVQCGAVYELKTASSIISDHRIQTLDYLFLTNIQHGKIINFRTPSVTHEFVSTGLTSEKRKMFSIHESDQFKESSTAQKLKKAAIGLFNDWGLFLDTTLYKEALCHLIGNGTDLLGPVSVTTGETVLGRQNIPFISPRESFCVSSVTENPGSYREHLLRFLRHTDLRYLHWINLCRSDVYFTSLENNK